MVAISPLAVLSKRIKFESLALIGLLIVWAALTILIFFHGVVPSVAHGTVNTDFAVDTTVYTHIADAFRTGEDLPYALGSVLTFPNTALTPVAIAFAFKSSPLLIFLFNSILFAISIALISRSFSMSMNVFMVAMLMNPTTTISLLCLNKEILDVLVISLFLFSLRKNRIGIRILALAIAILNRYEICVVLLVFLFARGRFNPLRRHRKLTLLALVMLLTLSMPLFASSVLSTRFQEARYGGAVAVLDGLQLHYLYIVAVIPKIAEDLFGQLVNSAVWKDTSSWLVINLFNNLANAVLFLTVINKRMFKVSNDLMYLCMLGAVFVAQALAIQPRYFYFIYLLTCIQIAHGSSEPSLLTRMLGQPAGDLVDA